MTTPSESTPYWRDARHGSRNRVAHYLFERVGEGHVFSKDALRDMLRMPDGRGIEQIDRRMRELREVGWVIRNYKDMATLAPNELFLEKVGAHTWEPSYRPPRATALSATDRRKVFERDGKRCKVCGIDFGAEYPHLAAQGKHIQARPTVGHWTPRERGGTDDLWNLRAECHLCNEPSKNLTAPPVDARLVTRKVKELRREDKRTLAGWLLAGRRTFTPLENIWAEIQQLPEPEKVEIRQLLGDMLGD
ncbi:MAG TPA: HNH endonuclease [Pyrinomonadaceae bacterium]